MTAPENSLDRARSALLAPGGLDLADLERTLDALMRPGIDAADLYFQDTRAESWVLEDGIIRTGNHHVERGVGLRAQSGEKTGFAYSDEIVAPALIDAASNARAIVRQGQQGGVQAWSARSVAPLNVGASPLDSLPVEDKLSLLRRCDAAARSSDSTSSGALFSSACCSGVFP